MTDIIENIKGQFKNGGMHIKLLFVNIAFFILVGVGAQVLQLFNAHNAVLILIEWTTLSSDFIEILLHPWTIVMNIFIHIDFWHLFTNMINLFIFGGFLYQFLGSKRVLSYFVIGGLIGSVLQILAFHIFPLFDGMPSTQLLGASGGVSAVAVAAATYRPNQTLNLFGLFQLKLWILVAIIVGLDFARMGQLSGVGHFAHIGGAMFGFIGIRSLQAGKDITTWFDDLMVKLPKLFKRKPRSKMKVEYSKSRDSKPPRNDYDYNESKAERQAKVDAILDKIKYKGYDGLSKAEKDYLSNQ